MPRTGEKPTKLRARTMSFTGDSALYTKKLANDLTLLEELSEESINDILKKRFKEDLIYTYIGPVLVSMNPYRDLGIYTEDRIQKYVDKYMHELAPHIFALAEDTHRILLKEHHNQCIIISGESGAGKTEASKQIMKYIAAVSAGSEKIQQVKDQILMSNPVLEAFGNAKTMRNNNSSRFGKYMQIVFDFKGDPVGGIIQNYLLEKSRIVHPAKGERSFHIFYQLAAGAAALPYASSLNMKSPKDFKYLSQSECLSVDQMDDNKEFSEVLHGMRSLGLSEDEQEGIFRTVAAVMWLGQVEFEPKNGEECKVKDMKPVSVVAELIRCDEKMVHDALVSRGYQAGSEKSIVTPLDVEKAYYTRDALAKTIYFRLFDWIISRTNIAIDPLKILSQSELDHAVSIGVLDIYGFEIFESNSFEQFCINFVNEKLQQIFIEHTLKTEQEEYEKENIKWVPIDYFNNKVVCDLIEAKPIGVISLLDEACLFPKGTDQTFLQKMEDNFLKKHPHYDKPARSQDAFTIKHYAGDVSYVVTNFLDKNKDLVWKDLLLVGESSDIGVWKEMFPADEIEAMGKKRPPTAGTQFKTQVNSLMATLEQCTPHYIRCIKPNDVKKAGVHDDERVVHQIRYLGLLENIRVRRAGFAFRQNQQEFLKRYKMLSPATWPNWDPSNAGAGCKNILDDMGVSEGDQYQLGLTKVFIKNPLTVYEIEEIRSERLHDLVTVVTKRWKGYIQRKRYAKLRATVALQKYYRGYVERGQFQRLEAAVTVQKYIRGHAERERSTRVAAALELQRHWRAYYDREQYLRLRGAVKIQKTYRGWKGRKEYLEIRTKAIGLFKGHKQRRKMSVRRYYQGVYCSDYVLDKVRAALPPHEVDVFLAGCTKTNRKGKADHRVLVLTSQNIHIITYPLKPEDKIKIHVSLPVKAIDALSFSSKADNFFVVHSSSKYDLLLNCEQKTEFVTALNDIMKQRGGAEVNLNFTDEIKFHIKGKKQKTVRFVDDEKVQLEHLEVDKEHKDSFKVSVGNVELADAAFMNKLEDGHYTGRKDLNGHS